MTLRGRTPTGSRVPADAPIDDGEVMGDSRRTAATLALMVVSIFAVLWGRLIWLQACPQPDFERAVVANLRGRPSTHHLRPIELPERATILDRNQEDLARSWYAHDLVIDATQLVRAGPDRYAQAAAFATDVVLEGMAMARIPHDPMKARGALARGLTERDPWLPLVRGLTPTQVRIMQESMERARRLRGPDGERLHPAGVRYEPRLKRSYPLGGTMVQVVGLVGEAQDDGAGRVAGRTGLELWLDQVLEGRRGALFGQRDGRGKGFLLGEADLVVPTPGTDVVLTLDARIQEFCLEVLAASVEESRAESASAVVLDAHTGEILACASYPTADPDRLGEPGAEPRNLNLAAVLDLYEPGSIIKPLIVAWGLQTKTISMDEPWDCGGSKGYHFFGPRRVREFLANPGPLTTEGVLIKSSNVGATRIGFERLGVERLWEAFARFGLAGRLPVTFPYVPRCRHTRPEDMRRSGYSPLMTAVSFCQGYEIMLSPLAMARMYLPLANDGLLMEPRLLAQVGDQRIPDPPAVRVIDADVAWSVRQTLRRAVEEGTGRRLQGLPWSVAAKTGTPEITGTLLHNPVVCAIAPASAPRIVVAVVHHKVLKRGPGTYTGGAVSGPPARSIIEKTLRYLRVEADQ